jgi:hypothetical protein
MSGVEHEIGDVVQVDHIHLNTATEIGKRESVGQDTFAMYKIGVKQRPMLLIAVRAKWQILLYMTSGAKPGVRQFHKLGPESFVELDWPFRYPTQFIKGKDIRYLNGIGMFHLKEIPATPHLSPMRRRLPRRRRNEKPHFIRSLYEQIETRR